jgi:hypothetical protein
MKSPPQFLINDVRLGVAVAKILQVFCTIAAMPERRMQVREPSKRRALPDRNGGERQKLCS